MKSEPIKNKDQDISQSGVSQVLVSQMWIKVDTQANQVLVMSETLASQVWDFQM